MGTGINRRPRAVDVEGRLYYILYNIYTVGGGRWVCVRLDWTMKRSESWTR